MSSLTVAVVLTGVFGMFAGTCYVSGFTVIQERVDDALRGRMFATLYTIIRFCLLLSLAVSPWLASLLDCLSEALFDDRVIDVGFRVFVPGVRLTFWLGGLMTVLAALVVSRDMLRARGRDPPPAPMAARRRLRRPRGGRRLRQEHPGRDPGRPGCGPTGREVVPPGSRARPRRERRSGPWSSAGATSTPGPRRC